METNETFYVVSSLTTSRSYDSLPERYKYKSEAEAVEKTKNLIRNRQRNGQKELSFYILKAVAVVGVVNPPIEVERLVD